MTRKMKRTWLLGLPVLVTAAFALLGRNTKAADGDATEKNERCATRVSIALIGKSPAASLVSDPNPQGQIDEMLKSDAFIERFAGYLNASFNTSPGKVAAEDAPYYLAKHILKNNKPYKDLFLGHFNVDIPAGGAATAEPVVTDDPNGMGYFRSMPWLKRYAGNEENGLKISTAYHMLNNTLGLKLQAVTNAPEADVSATGRQKQPCAGCHYESWSALDIAAKVLTKRVNNGDVTTFEPQNFGAQKIADKMVNNDLELVTALVESEPFNFNSCRLAFKFLYNRNENACESNVFDACMQTFKREGTIQSAIATVAKDATFCQ